MQPNSIVWLQLECSWCSPKVTQLQENKPFCSHSVVKLHEAIQMFMMVDYVREMGVKKSFMHDEPGSFEHLLLLLFVFVGLGACLFFRIFGGLRL